MYGNESTDSPPTTIGGDDNVVGDQDNVRNQLFHSKPEDMVESSKGHANPANQVCSAHAALEWMVRRKQTDDNARQSQTDGTPSKLTSK